MDQRKAKKKNDQQPIEPKEEKEW